jgi:hypothetical protein
MDIGKALSDRPALKPDWGKPAVRNFRGEDGNGSYRAILLPEYFGRREDVYVPPSVDWRFERPTNVKQHP